MSAGSAQAEVLARITRERASWRALVEEVGEERMDEPGPMGDWTLKDLAAHLTGWRERTIARLEAGSGKEPPTPWPAALADDDAINQWIYQRNHERPVRAVLEEADTSYSRLAAAIEALPEASITTPGRFAWLAGESLAAADLFGHFHEEHEATLRAWLARG